MLVLSPLYGPLPEEITSISARRAMRRAPLTVVAVAHIVTRQHQQEELVAFGGCSRRTQKSMMASAAAVDNRAWDGCLSFERVSTGKELRPR